MVWRLCGICIVFVLAACAGNSSGGSASRLPQTTVTETTSVSVSDVASSSTTALLGVLDNEPQINAERFMVLQLELMAKPTEQINRELLDEVADAGLASEVVANISALAESESFFEDPDGPQLLVSRVNLPLIQQDAAGFSGYIEGDIATVEMCWDDNSTRLSLDRQVLEAFDRTVGLLLVLVMQDASWKVAVVDYEDAEVLDNCA